MKSSRRGFLSLLGGGAVAGPGALKKAVAAASSGKIASEVMPVTDGCYGLKSNDVDVNWLARDILEAMNGGSGAAITQPHESRFTDIDALVSVSPTQKARLHRQKHRDADLQHQLRRFVEANNLNWVGLTEEKLMTLIKKAARD